MTEDFYAKTESDVLEERTLRFQPGEDHPRLDLFLASHLENMSRSHIQKIIRNGTAYINGEQAAPKSKVRAGDEIVLVAPPPEPADIEPQDIPFGVLFEDDSIIVVDKPRGLTVHPTMNRTSGTLVNALMHHCGDSLSGIAGELRPGIVHRLDKDTSGVMVVAKSNEAHISLSEQIKDRKVDKLYTTVVHGIVQDMGGVIEQPIGRNPGDRKKMAVVEKGGRSAVTEFSCVERFTYFTILDIKLHTGRTHQIRVHMSHIGNPVVGDPVYGGVRFKDRYSMSMQLRQQIQNEINMFQGQALHARELAFRHPMTGEPVRFEAPLPPDMSRFIDFLKNGGEHEIRD